MTRKMTQADYERLMLKNKNELWAEFAEELCELGREVVA